MTVLGDLLESPRLTAALTTAGIGSAVFAFPLRQLMGWPGHIAALALIVLLMLASLIVRRDELARRWVLPVSLLAYLGWAALSLVWSQYQWVTVGSLIYLGLFTVMGVFIGLSRDTIQVVRSTGDVLRVALAVSLALEVFSGILIDAPIPFLGIDGGIATGGAISGVLNTRNALGLAAVIGAATFAIEWRTRSITRGLAIGSLALAALVIAFTRSPVVFAVGLAVGVAAAALYGIRRLPPGRRQWAQYAVLTAGLGAAVVVWLSRSAVIALFNAGGELQYRLELWRDMLALVPLHQLEGWGWIGLWNSDIPPYSALITTDGGTHGSGLNAGVDVLLQLGAIGLVLLLVLVGLAGTRSWLLAGRRSSVVFTWPALVLVALVTVSMAESAILVEFGWLALVVCSVKASDELSWRQALRAPRPDEPELPHRPA